MSLSFIPFVSELVCVIMTLRIYSSHDVFHTRRFMFFVSGLSFHDIRFIMFALECLSNRVGVRTVVYALSFPDCRFRTLLQYLVFQNC